MPRRCATLLIALTLADRPQGVTSVQLAKHVRQSRDNQALAWASTRLRRAALYGYLEVVGGEGLQGTPFVYAITELGCDVLEGRATPWTTHAAHKATKPHFSFEELLRALGPALW